ncbi:hypothetical protein E8E14_002483 [Neopestalotiopsis sp. 37M]|nr:hypothetical protein E8E14_002483 [Neopestalotiopsis sp. 37M]
MRPLSSSFEGEGPRLDATASAIEVVIKLIPVLLLCLVPVLFQIGRETTTHTGVKERPSSRIIRSPPIIASRIPFIGHALGFLREGHDYFARLTSEIKCPAFTISMLGQKLTFVQPELARHVARNPHLLFMPVTVSIFRRALHFDPSTCDLLMEKTESSRSFSHRILGATREVLASPQALPRHISIFEDCLDSAILELVDQDQGRVMAVSEWTIRLITTAVGRVLWGDVAGTSLVSDDDFVEQLQFVMANLRSLTGPEWLISRKLKASRSEIRTRLKRDARNPTYQPGSFSEKLHELCQQEGGTDDTFADLQLLLVGGTSPNPALAASWFLMHLLCGDQQWFSDTRDELRAWVDREDGHINLRQAREHCPRLMATWCESLRHHSGFAIGRYASQDTVLANQWNLDKDSFLMVSLQTSHVGEDAWGSWDAEFVPQRFLNSDGSFNLTRERQLKTFGMLGTMCPGKTLAIHMAMGLAIRLLYSLDFDLAGSELRQLPPQSNNSLLGVPSPTSDLMVSYSAARPSCCVRFGL